jgi:Leucine-rich repeat (LRR) protein
MFSGDIALISTLTALTILDLSSNLLSDASRTVEAMATLTLLTSLKLGDNRFVGSTLQGLSQLTRLRELELFSPDPTFQMQGAHANYYKSKSDSVHRQRH